MRVVFGRRVAILKSLKFRSAIILASALGAFLGFASMSSAADLIVARRARASATPTPAAPTLQMSLVYPANGVLSSGSSETIQAAITVSPPPAVPVHRYRVVIAVRDSKGRLVRHHSFHPIANQSLANLDMKSVPAGSYDVTAEVYQHGHQLTDTNPYTITKQAATPISTNTATPTPAPTQTPAPTITPSATSTPSRAPTPTASPTRTVTPTAAATTTRTATPTQTATRTADPSPTPTASQTRTATPTATATTTRTATPTQTATRTADPTPTPTASPTRTVTPTASATTTRTATPTQTATRTAAATPTPSASRTGTSTPTPSATRTITMTPTVTPTGTARPTQTATPTPRATGSPNASGLDQYGGTTSVQCSSGAAPHFYTEQIGNRWWLCDPAGNGFFLKGVYYVVSNANSNSLSAKYAAPLSSSNSNWALEQLRRLQLWGFNVTADYSSSELSYETDPAWESGCTGAGTPYSWCTGSGTATNGEYPPILTPFVVAEQTTLNGFENRCSLSSPLKDVMNGVGRDYTGPKYNFGDYFDPNYPICVTNLINADTYGLQAAVSSRINGYLIYITMDESDETGFAGAGSDFETVGNIGTYGSGPDPTPNAAWVVLASSPVQTENSRWSATYSDCKVYSKLQLVSNLSTEYGGSIGALNNAWGSTYTGFYSSQSGYTVSGEWGEGHTNCSGYTAFGTGTGLLDEAGANSWVGNPSALSGETGDMQADMHTFYVAWLDEYYSILTSKFSAAAPGVLLQAAMGGWGAPPHKEVLTEIAKYVTLPNISQIPNTGMCTDCSSVEQEEIDFVTEYLGNTPYINWDGFWAQPDSAESTYEVSNPGPYSTQAARGVAYQSMVSALVNATDTTTSTYHIVGFDWWGGYDMNSQEANWGLMTPDDNPYDGCSATIAGCGNDAWGYTTGGEAANYGDFIDPVTSANTGVYSAMAP